MRVASAGIVELVASTILTLGMVLGGAVALGIPSSTTETDTSTPSTNVWYQQPPYCAPSIGCAWTPTGETP